MLNFNNNTNYVNDDNNNIFSPTPTVTTQTPGQAKCLCDYCEMRGKGSERQKSLHRKSKKNIESLKFEMDQNIESQIYFRRSDLMRTSKVFSERQKSKRATTYGVLPMCSKACGGLG
jgi:hypothetical protein